LSQLISQAICFNPMLCSRIQLSSQHCVCSYWQSQITSHLLQ
jgi:hypothetical protein